MSSYWEHYQINPWDSPRYCVFCEIIAGKSPAKIEYQDDILQLVGNKPGRNRPCPCGSGVKYKRCHLDEVEAVKRRRLR